MSGPVRIAFDAGNLVRDRRGMGRLARAILREAAGDPSVDVTLVASSRADRAVLRNEFSSPVSGWRAIAVDDVRETNRRGRFDVTFYPFNGVRFRSASPSLVLIHDVFAFTEPHRERIARHREQAPILRAARESDAIVTTTQWNRNEIARELRVPLDRIQAIAPVPDPFFSPSPGTPDAWNALIPEHIAARPFVLAVGGGEVRKNLVMLVEACARAFAGRDEQIVVVGSLGEADRRRIAATGMRAFHVDAGDELLRSLYRSAALVAVPSKAEGFGLVAVEAMACGAAVLAGAGSGLTEATRGAATLLPPDDVGLWAGAIRTLLDDDVRRAELAARGASAFATADRTAHARGTIDALKRLASLGSSPR